MTIASGKRLINRTTGKFIICSSGKGAVANGTDATGCCGADYRQARSCVTGELVDVWMTASNASTVTSAFYITGNIGRCYTFGTDGGATPGTLYTPDDVTTVSDCSADECVPTCYSCDSVPFCISATATVTIQYNLVVSSDPFTYHGAPAWPYYAAAVNAYGAATGSPSDTGIFPTIGPFTYVPDPDHPDETATDRVHPSCNSLFLPTGYLGSGVGYIAALIAGFCGCSGTFPLVNPGEDPATLMYDPSSSVTITVTGNECCYDPDTATCAGGEASCSDGTCNPLP